MVEEMGRDEADAADNALAVDATREADGVDVDWDAVKADYYDESIPLAQVLEHHGITHHQLRGRQSREHWAPRRRRTATSNLVKRLFVIFDHQLKDLELHMMKKGRSGIGDKEAMLLGNMTKTLDKLLDLEGRTKGGSSAKTQAEIMDIRKKLEAHVERLRKA